MFPPAHRLEFENITWAPLCSRMWWRYRRHEPDALERPPRPFVGARLDSQPQRRHTLLHCPVLPTSPYRK